MFGASFISGFRDFTRHLTSGILRVRLIIEIWIQNINHLNAMVTRHNSVVSLAKNVVRMRCAKNHVSGFQRCNWFRSENACENRVRRMSDGCRVMVIARWLFFHICEKPKLDLSSLFIGSYSVDNLASWGSSTNAASRFIFLQSTSEDAASRRKMPQKRSVI